MAEAAIKRLKLNIPYYVFTINEMIPAAAQGAVAVEVSTARNDLENVLLCINHQPSFDAVEIERKIIDKLDGGCKTPVGCLVNFNGNTLSINAYLSDMTGEKVIKIENHGASDLLFIQRSNEEIIIPIEDNFFKKFDNENKLITVDWEQE